MSEQTQATPDQTQQAPATQVELTVQDLGLLRSIIDVASQRGAFKANEMEQVGKAFNKLDNFLQTVQQAQEQAQEGKGEAKDG